MHRLGPADHRRCCTAVVAEADTDQPARLYVRSGRRQRILAVAEAWEDMADADERGAVRTLGAAAVEGGNLDSHSNRRKAADTHSAAAAAGHTVADAVAAARCWPTVVAVDRSWSLAVAGRKRRTVKAVGTACSAAVTVRGKGPAAGSKADGQDDPAAYASD